MRHKSKKQISKHLMLILTGFIITSSFNSIALNSNQTNEYHPGEITEVIIENQYPTIGKPVTITIKLKGNPTKTPFEESLEIQDSFEGIIPTIDTISWQTGHVYIDQNIIRIGRKPTYIKKIQWYPVIVGNHTLSFKAGDFPAVTISLSVGYVSDNIIYPSLGCPTLINKVENELLTVLISEERKNSETPLTIENTTIESINGSTSFSLSNEKILLTEWIEADTDVTEEELLVSYNLSSIPTGFYNLTVTTQKNTYFWPHSIYIQGKPPTSYQFIQITDTHIGKNYNLINEKQTLENIMEIVNNHIKPTFIFITGDLIDWWKTTDRQNVWDDIKEIMQKSKTPIFTLPGNHERYQTPLRKLYYPFKDNTPYHQYINPLPDYAFNYGKINYIALDSGYEYSRWEIKRHIWAPTPESSGLTNTQMYLLENHLELKQQNQIILMHHPAVNTEDDKGLFHLPDDHPSGNNECIANNRVEFINYCIENNVSLVLTGHTHTNHVLNSIGEEPSNPNHWPLFIQTDSILNNKGVIGRLITVDSGTIINYNQVSVPD